MLTKHNRQVALLTVPGELLLDIIMASKKVPGFGRSYLHQIQEVHVSADLQELSGPPRVWDTALVDAKIIDIRSTTVEDRFELLIQSPSLREVPAGNLIPRIVVTHRKDEYCGKIRSSDSI